MKNKILELINSGMSVEDVPEKVEFKNIQQLIDYLEAVKEQSGEDTEVRVDGQVIREFDDYIYVNHVEDYIDFVTPSYKSM